MVVLRRNIGLQLHHFLETVVMINEVEVNCAEQLNAGPAQASFSIMCVYLVLLGSADIKKSTEALIRTDRS